MLNLKLFTKKETVEFINSFEANTTKLEEPMIGWYGDGAYELEDALKKVNEGFLPEGISISAKRPDEDYWDSIFIYKDEDDDFLITTDDMSSIPDVYAYSINEALQKAQENLIKYINES